MGYSSTWEWELVMYLWGSIWLADYKNWRNSNANSFTPKASLHLDSSRGPNTMWLRHSENMSERPKNSTTLLLNTLYPFSSLSKCFGKAYVVLWVWLPSQTRGPCCWSRVNIDECRPLSIPATYCMIMPHPSLKVSPILHPSSVPPFCIFQKIKHQVCYEQPSVPQTGRRDKEVRPLLK